MELDWGKVIPAIEIAMGFKLYDYQKDFIQNGTPIYTGRRSGKTLAYCIRMALIHEEPIRVRDIYKYRDEDHGPAYHQWFKHFFMDIWETLKQAGLPVVEIKFEKRQETNP